MKLPSYDGTALRVLSATLKLTTVGEALDFDRIAFETRTSNKLVRTTLFRALDCDEGGVNLSPHRRIRLAMEIARVGQLGAAAKALTWQEFERFAQGCLQEAGFDAKRNVRVEGEGRAWQIDVVGFRGDLMLAIDCKHWSSPSYVSRFKQAGDHQRRATLHLLATVKERRQGLAVILTLREPPAQFSDGTVLVSVEKLPNFLSSVTPYDENLPFISSPLTTVENPMSQSK